MKKLLLVCIFPIALLFGCTKDKKVNFFTVQQDIKLGEQLDVEIQSNATEYPVLDKAKNPAVYAYLEAMRDDILSSNLIFHRSDFTWKVTIINKNVLNAFAAPGGKIYIYSGLLKNVKSSAELAGILAHEIVHADRRHSTQQMTKNNMVNIALSVILGQDSTALKNMAKQMASGAAAMAWSREYEYEADSMAVDFVYSIRGRKNYKCDALTDFFKRMDASSTATYTPEWLQTHPLDSKRIARVNGHFVTLGSPAGDLFTSEYSSFVAKLP